MQEAIILLGSNLGERYRKLKDARDFINRRAGKIIRFSSVYESEPWGFEGESSFLNQVLVIETDLAPGRLLETMQQIEDELGKKRVSQKEGYASRVIDIDILFYGRQIIETEKLTVPHKLLHERRFTLLPLNEIKGDLVHPVLNKTIRQLLKECPDHSEVHKTNTPGQ